VSPTRLPSRAAEAHAEGQAKTWLRWIDIVRLGLVQACLGACVVLITSTLNRIMVVELSLAALIPAAFVAWHYALQLSRPSFGHGSDRGGRRAPWIIGGMGVLGLGVMLAADGTILMGAQFWPGLALSLLAYTLIGAGVGACGTSLLAFMAARVEPKRRPAAAALTWILMIVGIIITAATTGKLLDPYSPERLAMVATGVAGATFLVTFFAIAGIEGRLNAKSASQDPIPDATATQNIASKPAFRQALAQTWADPQARQFTVFIFVSMLAYSAQDLILEPFAGLLFNYTVGQSTSLAGVQHGGVLLGMLLVGGIGGLTGGHTARGMQLWTAAGCLGSACALLGLVFAAQTGGAWPLAANVFALGFGNGVFAVAAIGSMMGLAGSSQDGKGGQEGIRMGVWGASQAIAFGVGGFSGAAALDALRRVIGSDAPAFQGVFALEAGLFVIAALMALSQIRGPRAQSDRLPAMPTEFNREMAS